MIWGNRLATDPRNQITQGHYQMEESLSQIDNKRYYWLQLKSDFFNSDDIKMVLAQKNGEKYVIFWQKLLLKAITASEVGVLKYKESIPYTPEMLSTITDTDIDTVKASMDIFVKLGMVGILPDGSFWLEEAQKMVGSETHGAKRKRAIRAQKRPKIEGVGHCPPLSQNCPQELELELDIELELDKDIGADMSDSNESSMASSHTSPKRFTKPTIDQITEYCQQRGNSVEAPRFFDYYEARGWELSKGRKMKDWKAAVRTWERNDFNNKSQSKKIDLNQYYGTKK